MEKPKEGGDGMLLDDDDELDHDQQLALLDMIDEEAEEVGSERVEGAVAALARRVGGDCSLGVDRELVDRRAIQHDGPGQVVITQQHLAHGVGPRPVGVAARRGVPQPCGRHGEDACMLSPISVMGLFPSSSAGGVVEVERLREDRVGHGVVGRDDLGPGQVVFNDALHQGCLLVVHGRPNFRLRIHPPSARRCRPCA